MASIKPEATNGLVINQVNISYSMQIILTKFAVTVVSFLLVLFLNVPTLEEFISIGIMFQPFDVKYLKMSLNQILWY